MIQDFADWLVYGLFGLSADTPIGVAVNFFFYDTIKILILLFFISVLMGIINAYFPIERLRNYLVTHKNVRTSVPVGFDFRSNNPVLFLFLHSVVHRVCKGRYSVGSNLCFSDNLTIGE